MALTAWTRARIVAQGKRYPRARSAVLPSLWAVQEELGHLTPEGIAEVAEILALTPTEVEAVSTFYSMYFQHPAGRHSLVLCTNVACGLRGSDDIARHIEQRLQCGSGETTADGAITWERTVECLGGCGEAPVLQLDHRTHGPLTAESVDELLESARG